MKHTLIIFALFCSQAWAEKSICYGTTSNGKLEHGVQLPSSGKNFLGYSFIGRIAGRTYVHSEVKDIILKAYEDLEMEYPNKVYKYAETGFKNGGLFKPHKTHQNGLSVDFMTPVLNAKGGSVHLLTNPFNKFGYNIEFDENNEYKDLKIDYEAIAAHIVALDKAARKSGFGLWRVIFAPELQPFLIKTKYGSYLKGNIEFSKKRSWVRHDEHYHIDFAIPCA